MSIFFSLPITFILMNQEQNYFLKCMEGRVSTKAYQNWDILSYIFGNIKDDYIIISKKIVSGKFNLFRIPSQNYFTKGFQDKKMKEKYNTLQKQMSSMKIFTLQDKTVANISSIVFFDGGNNNKSREMNKIFSFLYDYKTLNPSDFEELLQFVNQSHYIIKISKQFMKINQILQKLKSLTFQNYCEKFQNLEKSFQHLQIIYSFMIKNFQNQLFIHSIILTQALTFKKASNFRNFVDIDKTKQYFLKIKQPYQYDEQFQELADILKINFKEGIIHQKYASMFSKHKKYLIPTFSNVQMLNLFKQHFQKQKLKEENILQLGRFLTSINVAQAKIHKLASTINKLSTVLNPFTSNSEIKINPQNKQLNQIIKSLKNMFEEEVFKLMKQYYDNSSNLIQFSNYFIKNDKNMAQGAIIKLLQKYQTIWKFPNMDEVFTPSYHLYIVVEGYKYLDAKDLAIREQFFPSYNELRLQKIVSLNKMLIDTAILTPSFIKTYNIQTRTYQQLFSFIINYYNHQKISKNHKLSILNYACNIYEEYIVKNNKTFKIKYQTFKGIIDNRHSEYANLLEMLNNDEKDLICKFFGLREHFSDFKQLIQKYDIKESMAILRARSRQQQEQKKLCKEEQSQNLSMKEEKNEKDHKNIDNNSSITKK